jgi:hypothetical protein
MVERSRQTTNTELIGAGPLLPRKAQKPPDHGLFDLNVRNQLELFG